MNNIIKKELQDNTKVRESGGSKLTTIPKPFVQLLDLKKSDTLYWKLNLTNGEITITTQKK